MPYKIEWLTVGWRYRHSSILIGCIFYGIVYHWILPLYSVHCTCSGWTYKKPFYWGFFFVCVYFDLGALRNVLQKQYFIIYLFIAQNYLDSENQWIPARRYNCILSLLLPHKRLCSYKDLDYNNPLKRGNSDFNSAVKSVSINSDSLSYTLL